MNPASDTMKDFTVRAHADLALLDQQLEEWQASPEDDCKQSFVEQTLQSVLGMASVLRLDDLQRILETGQSLLRSAGQLNPMLSRQLIGEFRKIIHASHRLMFDLETRPFTVQEVSLAGRDFVDSESRSVGGTHQAVRNQESFDASLSLRLIRLIDELMSARHQIRQVFAHAVRLTCAEEQAAFLDRTCSTCPELKASLLRLLTSDEHPERLLEFPASELIRMLLDSLRDTTSKTSGSLSAYGITVPPDAFTVDDVENTVRVKSAGIFIASEPTSLPIDASALPRPFGRYVLECELGRGGMGTVFLATDRLLNRQVALKLLRVKPEDDQTVFERFYREARAMASVQHVNLCPVYDFGEIDGQPYLTMAFIEGESLSQLLKRSGSLLVRQAATLVRTLALALHQAHQAGIVHRDLKPANIMIKTDGEPVLMDFGLARCQQPTEAELTQPGMIIGSPAYMAPEQAEGRIDHIGPATDVHALGVILYEMVGGQKPFEGTVASILAQIHSKAPPPLNIEDGVRLDPICQKAMAKSIADRYVSAAEFADALTAYLNESCNAITHCKPFFPQAILSRFRGVFASRWRCATATVVLLAGIALMTLSFQWRSQHRSSEIKVGSTSTFIKNH